MQARNQWSVKRLCDIYIYSIKFGSLEVREIGISLLKLCGGTAQLRTLEGTLLVEPVWTAAHTQEACRMDVHWKHCYETKK